MLMQLWRAVARTTKTNLAQAMEDLEHGNVLYCRRQLEDRKLTVRFVKGESIGFRERIEISSSKVRAIMQTKHTKHRREALELMALSTHVLWRYVSTWLEKARLGASDCIIFPRMNGGDPEQRCDMGVDLDGELVEDWVVKRKKQCLVATRQGAGNHVGFPPACEDDMVLGRKQQEPNLTQRPRRKSC